MFIALLSLSLCVSLVCFCTILLTCNLFSFNADVNWQPGSASPYGYSILFPTCNFKTTDTWEYFRSLQEFPNGIKVSLRKYV